MTKERSPWLEAAIAMSEDLKKETPEVQAVSRQMSKKTYPEAWKAIREKEEEQQ